MRPILAVLLVLAAASAAVPAARAQDTTLVLDSPSRVLRLTVSLRDGAPTYRLDRLQRPVVTESRLGLTLRDGRLQGGGDRGADPRLRLASATRAAHDAT